MIEEHPSKLKHQVKVWLPGGAVYERPWSKAIPEHGLSLAEAMDMAENILRQGSIFGEPHRIEIIEWYRDYERKIWVWKPDPDASAGKRSAS